MAVTRQLRCNKLLNFSNLLIMAHRAYGNDSVFSAG